MARCEWLQYEGRRSGRWYCGESTRSAVAVFGPGYCSLLPRTQRGQVL